VLAAVPRLILLVVSVWAFTGPIDRVPSVVGAAGLTPAPAASTLRASPVFQESGFAVADGPIGNYFVARGGVRTFGPPVSNEFMLLGSRIQIFRNHVLKVEPNGSVSTVNLFALGAIPFRDVGGRIVPEVDQELIASAPIPGTPDYAARVQAFIQANAPDQWENMPVGFHQEFLATVQYEDALPNGGEKVLLSGFSHEVWGVPVSRPIRDAQNRDVVLLRWERGVMAWNSQRGAVTALPLGETFKQVLTGEELGSERTGAAAGSRFLMQFKPDVPNGVARPSDLPNSELAAAFTTGNPAVNAAQLTGPYGGTLTPTPTPPGWNVPLPGANVYPPRGSVPPPGANLPPPPGGSLPPPGGSVPTNPGALPGAVVAGSPAPLTGADPCYQDEQITFAPAEPRVNNEVLIAVSSSGPHPYGRLAGTERTTFVRERQGQLGIVWEWTVMLSYPGRHQYTFYVDSTVPCKSIEITVGQALSTRTPTPTKVPTPWGFDNGNSNSNNSNGNNNNSNDNTTEMIAPFRDLSIYVVNTTANNLDCAFFQSQGEAQRTLRLNPADPSQLDIEDGVADGIACTTHSYPTYPNDRDFGSVAISIPPATSTSIGLSTPTPAVTPPPVSTPTRAQRIPGEACYLFANGRDAHEFLRANPTDPWYMDYDRNGIACGGTDGPTIGGVWMSQPFWQPPTVSTSQYPPNAPLP
jgi:hypothetical protein